jgi:putative Mg2+ transporter-C (MgtC) family protein
MIIFEAEDFIKAGFALGAGIVLGLEREMKDKAAGIKTITIICLGACLFAILSERIGGPNNATALAAYIVSGVGFIGAGTIFKEGASISGLTTAGIIWLSAAVGTSIGFAQYSLAIIYIITSLILIISVWWFEKYFTPIRQKKKFRFVLTVKNHEALKESLHAIRAMNMNVEVKTLKKNNDLLTATCESIVDISKIELFTEWTLNNPEVLEVQV